MILRFIVGAIASLTVLAAADASGKPSSSEQGQRNWLMVVKSINTNPDRSAAFDAWYDDIDVPDVLKVPGYMRARRGQREDRDSGSGTTDVRDGYVALYDIRSADIDKTIIAMLMASWRMDQVGRSTELIKVVERVYYRRLAAPILGVTEHKRQWLFLARTEQPPSFSSLRRLAANGHYNSATCYVLDRVLMHEPHSVPKYLTVFEIAADTLDEATSETKTIGAALPDRDHGMYLLITDKARP